GADQIRNSPQLEDGEGARLRRAADASGARRRGDRVRRREFITLFGGAATWPLAARAQQTERTRRIGVLGGQAADDPEAQANIGKFLEALQKLGWSDGRNIRIDVRLGAGRADSIRKYAAELAASAPDVIFVSGTASLGPLLQATRTVPIVFNNVVDPVGG